MELQEERKPSAKSLMQKCLKDVGKWVKQKLDWVWSKMENIRKWDQTLGQIAYGILWGKVVWWKEGPLPSIQIGSWVEYYQKSVANLKLKKISQEKKNVKKAKVLRPQIVQKELGTTSLFQSYLLSESNSGYVDFCNIRICAVIK